MRNLLLVMLIAVAALGGTGLAAQEPPAAVPDEMPFDIPYGPFITADRAADLVAAVAAEARRGARDWKLAIAVVDPAGELVYFYRMDGTQHASNQIAIGKARTSARFRRPTQAFFDAMQTTGGSIIATLDPTLIASPGGIPIVENGMIVGAIGCSGATGGQDHVACLAGATPAP